MATPAPRLDSYQIYAVGGNRRLEPLMLGQLLDAADLGRISRFVGVQASETVRLRNAAFRLFRTRTRTQAHAGTRTRSVCRRIEYEYEYHFIEYEYDFGQTLSRTVSSAALAMLRYLQLLDTTWLAAEKRLKPGLQRNETHSQQTPICTRRPK